MRLTVALEIDLERPQHPPIPGEQAQDGGVPEIHPLDAQQPIAALEHADGGRTEDGHDHAIVVDGHPEPRIRPVGLEPEREQPGVQREQHEGEESRRAGGRGHAVDHRTCERSRAAVGYARDHESGARLAVPEAQNLGVVRMRTRADGVPGVGAWAGNGYTAERLHPVPTCDDRPLTRRPSSIGGSLLSSLMRRASLLVLAVVALSLPTHAMAAPAKMPEFKDSVVNVLTENCWDRLQTTAVRKRGEVNAQINKMKNDGRKFAKGEEQELTEKMLSEACSPAELEALKGISNQAYHYLGSAKILGCIGKSFAEAMAPLIAK